MLPPNFGVTNFWLAPNREQVLLSNRDKDKSPTVDCGSNHSPTHRPQHVIRQRAFLEAIQIAQSSGAKRLVCGRRSA